MYTPRSSHLLLACCFLAVAAGCAKKEAAPDTTAMAAPPPAPPAPAPVNLADVAGKWNMKAVPTSGKDTSATTYVLNATASDSGWTITFPKRKPMAVKVKADADSIIVDAGPYPSARRKNVMVTTNGSYHLKDGNLTGVTTAHYAVKTADSVLVLNVSGTKAP